ncbi:hypothetical protein AK830_g2628 [Neonectria ditissima]|uniref:Xylanolytic transcriptional activator regulatory domain-containing protein n=1 Tax=Neonectria ditissima TaxID=78410 RepID=A0A0P7BRB1_9HYPO|nr:hypothetical protein AK830_g2628 [Neonectria ditissima]
MSDPLSNPNVDGRLAHLEQLLNINSFSSPENSTASGTSGLPAIHGFPTIHGPTHPFPSAFFLDSDFFTPLRETALAQCARSPMHRMAADHLGLDLETTCEGYFSSVHTWLPIISRKRIMYEFSTDPPDDVCFMLLLLCMRLCTSNGETQPKDSASYRLAKSLCSAAEMEGYVSIRLLQSLTLLAVYEYSHGIHPAAFLTISRAARLGILMGFHDRKASTRLFKMPETWTLREEQRRTWWAIFILDRLVNIETCGVPLAAPEPSASELLPVNDEDWDNGKIVPNESLYTKSFSSVTTVGSYAQLCQAAHMLSKVMHHREARNVSQDVTELLPEAKHLHQALSALQTSIERHIDGSASPTSESSKLAALALSSSARLILYKMYTCNEALRFATQGPIALETEMQKASWDGVVVIISSTARTVGRRVSKCPLVAGFLYYAARECAWFIREDHEQVISDALWDIVSGLRRLGQNWGVAGQYISLLQQGDVLKLIESSADISSSSSPF